MAEETKSGGIAPKPPAVGLEGGSPPNQPRTNPLPLTGGALPGGASASVPLFGGNRGGKKRTDGLPPGSKEAKDADREKDAKRKLEARRSARGLAEPAPLPAVGQTVPGAPPALVNGQGTDLVPVGDEQSALVELWDPGMFEGLFSEGVELCEKKRVRDLADLAESAALSQALVDQIKRDARYNPAFKATLLKSGPRALAKTLNRLGVSAKYSDEGLCALALLSLWFQGWRLEARLEELIEKDRKAKHDHQSQSNPVRPVSAVAGPGTVQK